MTGLFENDSYARIDPLATENIDEFDRHMKFSQ